MLDKLDTQYLPGSRTAVFPKFKLIGNHLSALLTHATALLINSKTQ